MTSRKRKKKDLRLPNNFGGVVYLGERRRKPYGARITIGWTPDGKQKYKYLGYFEEKMDAIECLIDFNKHPYDINARKMTLIEVWDMWHKEHEQNVSKGTMNVYRSAFKKMERLHKMPMNELRTFHFQKIVDEHGTHASGRMIKIVAGLLFTHAMKRDGVDKDYSSLIELPKAKKKQKKTTFTIEEIKLIESKIGERYGDMFTILLYTGMRIGELLILENANIDFEKRLMIGGIKTENGIDRTIPIHEKIIPIMKRYWNKENKFLFTAPRGSKYHYCNEGTHMNKYLKKLGLKHTCHETRHTFISQCDRLGIDKITLKRIVGHSTKDITEHYTHKNDEDLIKAIDAFSFY